MPSATRRGATERSEAPPEVGRFLTFLAVERGRSANTLAAYRRDLARYTDGLAERGLTLAAVRQPDVEQHLADLRADGLAPASVARSLAAVRALHRFLVDDGLAPLDPAVDVERPRLPDALPKALSELDVTRLLDAVVGDGPLERRDRAILEVLYGTGIRVSELCGLSHGDVDLDGALLRVFGKGSKERVVPLGRLARRALEAWFDDGGRPDMAPEHWRSRHDADAVFLNQRGRRISRQGVWLVLQRHGRAVGLADRLSPHVLRHSCATHLLENGADIRAVQELLGHASLTTTQVYTRVAIEQLRRSYDAAHPRAHRGGSD